MFPLQDNIPSRSRPVCNYLIIAVCSLIYFIQASQNAEESTIVERFGLIPARVLHPHEEIEVTYGAAVVETPQGLEQVALKRVAAPSAVPPWMTFITCTFLHGSLMHLVGNMWFLLIFGDNVEDRFGRVGYLVFYLVGGAIASLIHFLSNWGSTVPTVGASGAIAAVMGAYFVWYPHARIRTFIPVFIVPFFIVVPATLFLGLWFLMQFFQGTSSLFSPETGGVAWWAHIGGFGAGYLIAGAIGHTPICRPRNELVRTYPYQPPAVRLRRPPMQ